MKIIVKIFGGFKFKLYLCRRFGKGMINASSDNPGDDKALVQTTPNPS